jgi:hypothetical protein
MAAVNSTSSSSRHPTLATQTLRARLGLLIAALLVPIMVVLHAPLLAAIVPSAVITLASIQALERVEAATPPVITPALVDPRDPVEAERIRRAILVAGSSRVVS